MSWSEARSFCEFVGGHLAVLNEKVIDEFVQSKFLDDRLWIGATDIDQEGVWTWVDGQEMEPEKYSNWGPHAPNGGGSQNCLRTKSGHWNDKVCEKKMEPLCEHPPWPKCSVLE